MGEPPTYLEESEGRKGGPRRQPAPSEDHQAKGQRGEELPRGGPEVDAERVEVLAHGQAPQLRGAAPPDLDRAAQGQGWDGHRSV